MRHLGLTDPGGESGDCLLLSVSAPRARFLTLPIGGPMFGPGWARPPRLVDAEVYDAEVRQGIDG